MASSSNNSSSLALVTSPKIKNYYEVFVTFRGEDTRNNFTDHLFDALHKKAIFAFRDDTNLSKGQFIAPELLRAIENSLIFVVVFSRNYASSTWCLQELEKTLECVQVSGKHILPVFYDVDPSEVRKQSGIYGEAFIKHEQRFQQDSEMVQRWRKTLTQVGSISGWDVRHKPQSVAIKEIVEKIMNILDCKSSSLSKDLVGMNSPLQELENHLLLNSVDEVRAVGICGMGGIGKTTLAMALYDRISHQFGAYCVIDDVSKSFRLHDGPLGAQKQILHQILGVEHNQICNLYTASHFMRSKLRRVRALLILDNVDQIEQLEKIVVHREWLGPGSRIIIISRDEHVLKAYGVDEVYKVALLTLTKSRQLFCRKAFKLDHILRSYKRITHDILRYANGLPLAITVLGSFLSGRDISEWRSALARLRQSPDNDVFDVLRLSFDGLKETEKETFLHIACFFKGSMKKYVKNVLNCCGFHVDIELRALVDKSLITIEDERIEMHNLLQELGRKIAQENSSKKRRKWIKLWFYKQLYNVMLENKEKRVEALVLDHVFVNHEEEDTFLIAERLSKMSHLRLLILNYVKISGSLRCLSNELRYVEWNVYPFMYLPSSFQPTQLVELILKSSSIKQLWEGKKYLPKLKTLDLSYSTDLIRMPEFGEVPNLERLILDYCIKLVQLDPSIGVLRKLVYLNLKDCKNLVSIPNSIFSLSSLKNLNMSGCSKEVKNTRHLNISESASHSKSSSSITKLTMMPYHSMFPTPTTHTVILPSLPSLYCLCKLDISFCGLSQLPVAIGCLRWLERLNLGGNNFVILPSLRELSKLVYLNLDHCMRLESLPELPFPTAIEKDLRKKKSWKRPTGLSIFNCPKLGEMERCSRMTFSWMAQFIQVNKEYPAFFNIGVVIPGSEILSWFNNQSVGGSIPISPFMHDNTNNIIGFLCCATFYMAPHYPTFKRSYVGTKEVYIKLSAPLSHSSHLSLFFDAKLLQVESNHIWLMYFPWESSFDVMNEVFRVEIENKGGLIMEVKNCGYRWVYEQDLQEFNSTMMHPGNSLTLKRKFLAIEDEAQP